ncbi:hypothetical protein EXIGLDRAFT_760471 [Exidia glandulosa HHB12029]|uniref:Uncharacterized protein n=1 Tax=Exidia glandulosa HHB12029 TaxID=1314781 RepID=A0A165PA48_EXIGL|nr:hypothetical protein EXIGLDRAFT_760471 [Exidia glandulosa HHB12029]
MDPNRYAEAHERDVLRAVIRAATEARERRVDDARQKLEAVAAAKLAAKARITEAQIALQAARTAYNDMHGQERAAQDALKVAQRSIHDDPDVRRQHGLLHPIRSLPAELLGYIFTLAVHELIAIPDRAGAPFRIAGVSRRWREVALQTPTVWRRIHTILDQRDGQYAHMYPLWCTLAAERSGYRDIELVATSMSSRPALPSSLRIVHDLLARNAIKRLEVTCSDGCREVDWAILQPDLPVTSLRSISIMGDSCYRDLLCGLPTTAPNLRSITASLSHFVQPLPTPHLCITHVRILSYQLSSRWTNSDLLNTFLAYPNAKTVSIGHFGVSRRFPGILRHDALTSLHMSHMGGFPVLGDGFSFPALRHLTLQVFYRDHAADTSGSVHLISSGLSALQTLEYDAPSYLGVLVPALRTLPLLQSLVCINGRVDDPFLTAFVTGPDFLCPALVELRVGDVKTVRLAQQFVDAVSARLDAHLAGGRLTKLRSVSADFGPSLDDYKARLSAILLR